MIKKFLFIQLICFLTSLLLHCTLICAQERDTSNPVKIVTLMSSDYQEFREALAGFKNALNKADIKYEISLITNISNNGFNPKVIDKIRESEPDLILTLGTKALTNVNNYIKDIPIVFSMVLKSYFTQSIDTFVKNNANVTGVTLSIPVIQKFSIFKEIIPDLKTIGVIYSPDENSELINEAKSAAKRLNLDLVAANVSSERDVPKALNNLTRIVDVIWMILDNAVNSDYSREYIILEGFRNDIPVMGPSENYVGAGALCAVRANYRNVGFQSGKMAVKILNGSKPSEVPYEDPKLSVIYINERIAAGIGLKITNQIKAVAKIK